jgi:hypothetical protein
VGSSEIASLWPRDRPNSPRSIGKGLAPRSSLCRMGVGRSGLTRAFVSVGFTFVGVGVLPFIGIASRSPSSQNFYLIATAVGFVLLGVAFWAWLKTWSTSEDADPRTRIVSRLFAGACLVLGVAYLGLVNEVIQLHRQVPHVGLRRQLVSDVLSLGGFCLAAVGFWMASLMPQSRDSQSHSEEPEPTLSSTGR